MRCYNYHSLPDGYRKEIYARLMEEDKKDQNASVGARHGGPFVIIGNHPQALAERLTDTHHRHFQMTLSDGYEAYVWYHLVGITL